MLATHPLAKLYYVIVPKAVWENYWSPCFKNEEIKKLEHREVANVTQVATSKARSPSQLWLTPKPGLPRLHYIPLKSYLLLFPWMSMTHIIEVFSCDLN